VHNTFKCALNEALNIQNKIYNLMAEKGWYPMETADQAKINSTRQKYSNQ
jgi:spore coat protein CotF